MAELTRYHRLSAFSTPTVVRQKDDVVSKLALGGVKFRGRKLSDQAFINAAVMAICALPEKERRAVVAEQLRRLEEILEGNEPEGDGDAGITVDPQRSVPRPGSPKRGTRSA